MRRGNKNYTSINIRDGKKETQKLLTHKEKVDTSESNFLAILVKFLLVSMIQVGSKYQTFDWILIICK